MRIAVLLVLAACDAGHSVETPRPAMASPDPTTQHPAPPLPEVTVAAEPWTPATDAAGVMWAEHEGGLHVRWIVSPPSVPLKRDPEILQQPVTVEINGGDVMRSLKLSPQFGSLTIDNQSACAGDAYPLEKDEIAKITFYEGGAGGYFIRRVGDALTIYEWSQTDGACTNASGEMVACPRTVKRAGKLLVHSKPGARVYQEIWEVDDKGARTLFDCGDRNLGDY